MSPVPNAFRESKSAKLDEVSDAVDEVNSYLGKHRDALLPKQNDDSWRKSEKDDLKEKAEFRNYADAAESVKAFYREQHTKQ